MSWEVLEKRSFGPHDYGPAWDDQPCVAVTKNGITLNARFAAAYGLRARDLVCVFLDRKNRRVGFKRPTTEADLANARSVQGPRKGDKSALVILTKEPARVFADCLGRAFPAALLPGELVIAADLGPAPGAGQREAA